MKILQICVKNFCEFLHSWWWNWPNVLIDCARSHNAATTSTTEKGTYFLYVRRWPTKSEKRKKKRNWEQKIFFLFQVTNYRRSFFNFFVNVLHCTTWLPIFSFFSCIEWTRIGCTGINPGMSFTPFPSSIRWDLTHEL